MSLLVRRGFLSLNQIIRPYSEVVNVFGRRTIDTGKSEKTTTPATIPASAERVGELSEYPKELLNERIARIYIPAKNSMQSGTYGMRRWKIQFDHQPRWENETMGWGSTGDRLSNLELDFATREDAELYCQRMGFNFRVDEPHFLKKRIKSYGANFSWDKKTRRTAK